MATLDPWFQNNLACPADQAPLDWNGKNLSGSCGHEYAVIDGIPVLLRDDVEQTHGSAASSLERAASGSEPPCSCVVSHLRGDDSAPLSPRQADSGRRSSLAVHPYVQRKLLATHGLMYSRVVLANYPIPDIRLPAARSDLRLLDIGCNWGRWSLAAARKGYRVVGVDTSLEAITVARDIAAQLGVEVSYLVADGRYLPFRDDAFDVVYSFSVLQHFAKEDVRTVLRSIRRVLKHDGVSLIQMLNRLGARSLFNQARLSFRTPERFDVRYWTTRELYDTFAAAIGPTELAVDAFFSANAQTSDLPLLPFEFQLVVRCSERLRALTNSLPMLKQVADSLYITSSASASRLSEVNGRVKRAG